MFYFVGSVQDLSCIIVLFVSILPSFRVSQGLAQLVGLDIFSTEDERNQDLKPVSLLLKMSIWSMMK